MCQTTAVAFSQLSGEALIVDIPGWTNLGKKDLSSPVLEGHVAWVLCHNSVHHSRDEDEEVMKKHLSHMMQYKL